jgi:hypothetical protein
MTVIQNIFFSGRTMQEKWLYQQKLSLYQYCSYKKIEEICPLKQIPVSIQCLMILLTFKNLQKLLVEGLQNVNV